MSTPSDLARRIYANLCQSPTRSLTTEAAMERYDLWGDGLAAVVAASNGYLRIRSPGLLEAVPQESRR
ncbi:hypothetical protein BN873_890034 [Candidatus Competibacter denitrificans Run_A_D11]|jgi:hypothetical protein|uniref:Uncharacterized protein n=1 Tax=Candidatus Competibacter denitrificans Run_A_D11 TaxID=1400863 RepID=W6ME76_9GAMM|nr:hypothetical protein [Candidatus Competibacter denitrificans]CDI04128.1 hypothetical protein BN873_890034 [Candidatus Competibacter denitrificans Run_A_D11]HRC69980.1 hypothetical protein [Candidatus Competibacter denitrificans]